MTIDGVSEHALISQMKLVRVRDYWKCFDELSVYFAYIITNIKLGSVGNDNTIPYTYCISERFGRNEKYLYAIRICCFRNFGKIHQNDFQCFD